MLCLLYLLLNLTKAFTRTNIRFSQFSNLNTKSRDMARKGLDHYKVMVYFGLDSHDGNNLATPEILSHFV